jgi:hypothetical protein
MWVTLLTGTWGARVPCRLWMAIQVLPVPPRSCCPLAAADVSRLAKRPRSGCPLDSEAAAEIM